jgi:hypothetical protein
MPHRILGERGRAGVKIEVHTVRYGNPDWLAACAPTLERWTSRHGYPLHVWTELDNKPEYPCLKFCMVDMWRQFASGESDWLVYIDGDIAVRGDAPNLDFLKNCSGMMIRRALHKYSRLRWWCHKLGIRSRKCIERLRLWEYRNTGWYALDRHGAKALLNVAMPPYINAANEEGQGNYWLVQAVDEHGLKVSSLPDEWNRFYWEDGPGWMWHLITTRKMEHLERIIREGKIERA